MLVCEHGRVLEAKTLFEGDGLAIADVACRHGEGRGAEQGPASSHMLVFVRRGCFLRSADGAESLLDTTSAYGVNPGEEERYDHPHPYGDDCTAVSLSPRLVASLGGGEELLPKHPLFISPAVDLEHRLLLSGARCAGERDELGERAMLLAAEVLVQVDAKRIEAGRPFTARARKRLVDEAREALADDPSLSLANLSHALAVSQHHLSRIFRAETGHTVARHKLRLRVRSALEQLADGERDLARLAVERGFSDQSHLCRSIRGETGRTPRALREALAA
jgi:AraC-like DNA-binding protein